MTKRPIIGHVVLKCKVGNRGPSLKHRVAFWSKWGFNLSVLETYNENPAKRPRCLFSTNINWLYNKKITKLWSNEFNLDLNYKHVLKNTFKTWQTVSRRALKFSWYITSYTSQSIHFYPKCSLKLREKTWQLLGIDWLNNDPQYISHIINCSRLFVHVQMSPLRALT